MTDCSPSSALERLLGFLEPSCPIINPVMLVASSSKTSCLSATTCRQSFLPLPPCCYPYPINQSFALFIHSVSCSSPTPSLSTTSVEPPLEIAETRRGFAVWLSSLPSGRLTHDLLRGSSYRPHLVSYLCAPPVSSALYDPSSSYSAMPLLITPS